MRTIELEEDTLQFLETFAADYRKETVTRPEARRLLKNADARVVKRLIRAGSIDTVQVGDELRVVVGSIEDYLIQIGRASCRERVEDLGVAGAVKRTCVGTGGKCVITK